MTDHYLHQIFEGDEDSTAAQDTRAYLYSLEFLPEDMDSSKKGATSFYARNARRITGRFGKYYEDSNSGKWGDWRDAAIDPAPKTKKHRTDTAPPPRTAYVKYPGKLFVKGSGDGRDIWFNDAIQGALQNCYLIAAMASAAITAPERIRSMIQDKGNGTYTIHFKDFTVPVDQDLPVFDGSISGDETIYSDLAYAGSTDETATGLELWPALLEKAYAKAYGGYASIEWGNAGQALEQILGRSVTQHDIDGGLFGGAWSEDKILQEIKNAISDRKSVLISTKSQNTPGITDRHVYVPLGVNSTTREVTLYNPGNGKIEVYPISGLKQDCDYLWIAN